MSEKVEWRDIPGYEDVYQVSNDGRVCRMRNGQEKQPVLHHSGFLGLTLCKNGQYKYFMIHRLVAMAFLNAPKRVQVYHKDRNKLNNVADNLTLMPIVAEWQKWEDDLLRFAYEKFAADELARLFAHRKNRELSHRAKELGIKRGTYARRGWRETVEAFWGKVQKGADDDCWLWLGPLNRGGYGHIGSNKRYRSAHRFSYFIHHGEIPGRLVVMHKCDNPKCVNPDHLKLGTHKDNSQDAIQKGRWTPGKYPKTGQRSNHGTKTPP